MEELPFDTLEKDDTPLEDNKDTTKYKSWFVFYAYFEGHSSNLWFETCAYGAEKRLAAEYGDKAVTVKPHQFDGCMVLLSPSLDDYSFAVDLCARMNSGEHPDRGMYDEALSEYANEWWEYHNEFFERLRMVVEYDGEIEAAFKRDSKCHPSVMEVFEESLNQ